MKARKMTEHIQLIGAVDWNRQLFDALIPLPDGTSYNAYLVRSGGKTALLDAVDPSKADVLMEQLKDVPALDYLIAHHAEQDHSGTIPQVMTKYPQAKLVCSTKAKGMLLDLLVMPEERIQAVADGETFKLGDLTFEFIYTPWVHWPETMCTYLREEKVLFSCDFFGSHLATADTFVTDKEHALRAAKRYYAEIMMPFRGVIQKNLERLAPYEIKMIAPSHGPVYAEPKLILDAYQEWVGALPKNQVVLPYISMHHSTELLVERLVSALAERGVHVQPFDLTVTDIGELAMALVDAATIVVGTPIMLGGAHPLVAYACSLATLLKPKAMFAAFMVSYGWGEGAVSRLPSLIEGLKVEALPGVIVRGLPREENFKAVDALADLIAAKHKEKGIVGT
jgi:flavorubredoxin